jgi:hypothetical protein
MNEYYRAKVGEFFSRPMATGLARKQNRLFLDARDVDGASQCSIEVDEAVVSVINRISICSKKADWLSITASPWTRATAFGKPGYVRSRRYLQLLQARVRLDIRRRAKYKVNALALGKCVGRNIVGDLLPYDHPPCFTPICLTWAMRPSVRPISVGKDGGLG